MRTIIQRFAAAAICLLFLFPQTLWAAEVNITYKAPESVKAGDRVKVVIDVSGSKAITTLGLRLSYDSDKLTYESESWSEGVKSVNAMTLVSDVEGDNGKVLNISMISDKGYQGSGTMVTLTFSAKGDLAEVPVELVLRDITDMDMQDISASTDVTRQKADGEGAAGNSTESGNDIHSGDDGSRSDSTENTGQNQGTGSTGSTSGGTISGEGGDSSNGSGASATYQTGMEIMDNQLILLGGIFLAAGICCLMLKRKLFS